MTSPAPPRPPIACCATTRPRPAPWRPASTPNSSSGGSPTHGPTSSGSWPSAARRSSSARPDSRPRPAIRRPRWTRRQAAQAAALADDSTDAGFYAYAVGEYARLAGDASAARAAYGEALAIRPGDLGAIIGLARIDAFEGDLDAAIDGLRVATGIAPQPESLALLGDLSVAAGDVAGATRSFDTVRFIEQLGDIQSTTFDRLLLRFELDHGGASDALLDQARASLATRPDWTGHDTVAWALYRLGRVDEAAAEIDAARALGADDARLRFHAGAIELARGNVAGAEELLASAPVRSGRPSTRSNARRRRACSTESHARRPAR